MKFQRTHQTIKELLDPRLQKLGSIKLMEAWEILQGKAGVSYDVVRVHFHHIMSQMVKDGLAERLPGAVYWIYKNRLTVKECQPA